MHVALARTPIPLRAEQMLVLSAARSSLTDSAIDHELLSAEPAHTLALAAELGVVGIVADRVRRIPGVGPIWERTWNAHLAKNMFLVAELRRWTSDLEAAGIESVTLKGPALGKLAFGNVGSRHFIDLDILVPPELFLNASSICLGRGWVRLSDGAASRPGAPSTRACFVAPGAGYSLDLHAGWQPGWGRVRGGRLTNDDLIEVDLEGTSVRTLRPGLALIDASREFVRHGHSLKALLDVTATLILVRSRNTEEETSSYAREMGMGRLLAEAVKAADEFVELGRAPSVPKGLGEPAALANPVSPRRIDLWAWFHSRRRLPIRQLIGEAFRTLWPSDTRIREAPEWIGPDHLVLRRLLRPVRLLTLIAGRAHPAEPPLVWTGGTADPPDEDVTKRSIR